MKDWAFDFGLLARSISLSFNGVANSITIERMTLSHRLRPTMASYDDHDSDALSLSAAGFCC